MCLLAGTRGPRSCAMPTDMADRLSPEIDAPGVTAAAQHRARATHAPSRRAAATLILMPSAAFSSARKSHKTPAEQNQAFSALPALRQRGSARRRPGKLG